MVIVDQGQGQGEVHLHGYLSAVPRTRTHSASSQFVRYETTTPLSAHTPTYPPTLHTTGYVVPYLPLLPKVCHDVINQILPYLSTRNYSSRLGSPLPCRARPPPARSARHLSRAYSTRRARSLTLLARVEADQQRLSCFTQEGLY